MHSQINKTFSIKLSLRRNCSSIQIDWIDQLMQNEESWKILLLYLLWDNFNIYRRVTSSNTFPLEPHPGQIASESDFLCLGTVTFWQKISFKLVTCVNTRDFTVIATIQQLANCNTIILINQQSTPNHLTIANFAWIKPVYIEP